jgi:hypothetical protein
VQVDVCPILPFHLVFLVFLCVQKNV